MARFGVVSDCFAQPPFTILFHGAFWSRSTLFCWFALPTVSSSGQSDCKSRERRRKGFRYLSGGEASMEMVDLPRPCTVECSVLYEGQGFETESWSWKGSFCACDSASSSTVSSSKQTDFLASLAADVHFERNDVLMASQCEVCVKGGFSVPCSRCSYCPQHYSVNNTTLQFVSSDVLPAAHPGPKCLDPRVISDPFQTDCMENFGTTVLCVEIG
ncbi:hypothetical protein KI387_034896 [Taxus chinensis]|uniref:Uncharacterized protein n=1 Tax=Taxus chinensis TaxID=29808 RepID=A0AA38C5M2_TAXCH|nr:hypothetical protein KI387_034896 [Taxus chinensis]